MVWGISRIPAGWKVTLPGSCGVETNVVGLMQVWRSIVWNSHSNVVVSESDFYDALAPTNELNSRHLFLSYANSGCKLNFHGNAKASATVAYSSGWKIFTNEKATLWRGVRMKMTSAGTGGDGVISVPVQLSTLDYCVTLNIIAVFTLHLLITASRYSLLDH